MCMSIVRNVLTVPWEEGGGGGGEGGERDRERERDAHHHNRRFSLRVLHLTTIILCRNVQPG